MITQRETGAGLTVAVAGLCPKTARLERTEGAVRTGARVDVVGETEMGAVGDVETIGVATGTVIGLGIVVAAAGRVGTLEARRVGTLEARRVGTLEARGVGTLEARRVGTLEARRALRRGVGASTFQRRGEGVHRALGCGLDLLARRKFRMRQRALSHSDPLSKTA